MGGRDQAEADDGEGEGEDGEHGQAAGRDPAGERDAEQERGGAGAAEDQVLQRALCTLRPAHGQQHPGEPDAVRRDQLQPLPLLALEAAALDGAPDRPAGRLIQQAGGVGQRAAMADTDHAPIRQADKDQTSDHAPP